MITPTSLSGPDDDAERGRVVQLLGDRLDAVFSAVPARLRRLIPAALSQLAAERSSTGSD